MSGNSASYSSGLVPALLLAAFLAGCTAPVNPSAPSETVCDQATVQALEGVLPIEPPEHLIQEDAERAGDEFDVNRLLELLTHLELEEGKVLDWVYRYEELGGEPFVYARSDGDQPFRTYQELQQASGSLERKAYLQGVQVDGTPQGYVEYALLHLLGDQFYLWWHAGSRDLRVICGRAGLSDALEHAEDYCDEMPEEFRRNALQMDPRTEVEIGDEFVNVRLHVFSKWGGLYRMDFELTAGPSPRVVELSSEKLVDYFCGIVF